MSRVIETQEIDSNDLWEITHAAKQLTAYGCSVSARHLKDLRTRMQFNRELAYYGKRVVEDVMQRRLSLEEGLMDIKREQQSLMNQSVSAATKWLGLAGGTAQVITGAGICYGSAGSLCASVGIPIMAHGTNNVYENGRNLYEGQNDTEGPVRKGYQAAARVLGYTPREGNMAYFTGDLAMSGVGMMRKVLKPDAWRLFRYIDADKHRAIMQMSKPALLMEIQVDAQTGYQLYEEYKK